MFKKSKVCTGVLLALGSASFLAVSAQAQEQLNRVEVTGSSIKRVAAEGALPVQTFTAKEIAKSGVTTVQDFIQQLPVMQGFAVAADSVGGGGGGVTTASIHDVGAQYTLVLLNGRRVAPSNSGTTIDLNSIPLAAVERIEVLTDGASALYGADAIAGVVNFILKKGEAPLTIDARYQMPQHKGGESYNLGISKGFGDIERDGFSIFAAFSYDKFSQLKAKDREFAKTGIINFTNDGRNLEFFNGSSRSVPPNVDVKYNRTPTPDNPAKTSTVSFNPYREKNGKCPDAHVPGGRQCIFDYTSSVEIFPAQERTSFFSSGEVKLGSSGLKLFGDLALTDAHIRARIAPYPAEFGLKTDHPYYTKYILPYLTPAQVAAGVTSVNVKYRLYDMGNRAYDYQTKANHAVIGLDGALLGWDFNTALTYSTQKQLQNYEGGFPLADKFNAAIQAQKFDPFPYTLGTMPPEMLQALNDTQYKGNYNTTDIKMYGVDARASRELFAMSGGAAAIAVGADFRKNSFDVRANQAVANAEILFDDPQSEFGLKRSNWGVFSEVVLPVTKQLELSGAVRFDSVSGVDDTLNNKKFGNTESASTYKMSFKYRPLTNLVTRGSYGTGFRVATMSQIAQPLVDFGVTGGSYACPFKASYDPLGYFAKGYGCDRQMEAFQGGNGDLKPESSKQWTLGFVFDAADNFSMGMDYWSVKVKDAVTSVSEDLIINNPAKYLDLYTTKTKASNGQTYVAIKLMPINIGQIENEGIDWNFVLRNNLPIGRLTTRLAGTYLVKSRYTTPGTSDQWEDSMDHWGTNSAVSFRNVMNASATLDSGAWSHTLNWNYRNGYKDIFHNEDNCAVGDVDTGDCVATQLTVKSYYTFDWQTRYAFNKSLTLVGGVTNLADMKPPLTLRNVGSHQLGYDPRYASPVGRAFYVSAQYKF
jgi:iron complex outermembrane receptor protein